MSYPELPVKSLVRGDMVIVTITDTSRPGPKALTFFKPILNRMGVYVIVVTERGLSFTYPKPADMSADELCREVNDHISSEAAKVVLYPVRFRY